MTGEEAAPPPVPDDGGGQPATGRRRRFPWARVAVATVVLGTVAALVIGLANRGGTAPVAQVVAPAERAGAPDITLPILQAAQGVGPEGADLRLADLRGRVVVLNFWAWWCFPCREEVPVLDAAAARYDPERVLFLGVNAEDDEADARRFLREHPFAYPSVRDPTPDAARAFGNHGYPTTLIVDPDGRVAARYPGAVEDERQLTEPIDEVLAER